jgi:hypothetical protein
MKFTASILGSVTALGCLLAGTVCQALPPLYSVPATANIYSAGLTTPVDPGGGGAGTLPILVPVSTGQSAFQFSASGSITENNWGGSGGVYHGPDGGPISGGTVYAYGGLSGFVTDWCVPLAGVFLSGSAPQDPAPPMLDFRSQGLGLDFLTLSPLIGQVFFIGDGQTGSGIIQTFYAPTGATRLFLGCPDSVYGDGYPGAYADNDGWLSVAVLAVPEPGAGALGVTALLLSAVVVQRKGSVRRLQG